MSQKVIDEVEQVLPQKAKLLAEPNKLKYDVIIVGGGLAGLTAACGLKQQRILLLEKETTIGGRILTKKQQNIEYDLGGLFAPQQEMMPQEHFGI